MEKMTGVIIIGPQPKKEQHLTYLDVQNIKGYIAVILLVLTTCPNESQKYADGATKVEEFTVYCNGSLIQLCDTLKEKCSSSKYARILTFSTCFSELYAN